MAKRRSMTEAVTVEAMMMVFTLEAMWRNDLPGT
jgi:hypothetical protein